MNQQRFRLVAEVSSNNVVSNAEVATGPSGKPPRCICRYGGKWSVLSVIPFGLSGLSSARRLDGWRPRER